MARKPSIKNAGSAPIYRETERLMLDCLKMVERSPNSVGVRQLCKRLIDTLLDNLTIIGLALNEKDAQLKLEYINSFYLQMRTVKTCIDTLKEWSNRSTTRVISNRQMPRFAESLESIFEQAQKVASQDIGAAKFPLGLVTTMTMGTFSLKNGRITGCLPTGESLVKNKIIRAITAFSLRSSENSQHNAWNVNFGDGNINNWNNKYNGNTVRAVAALPNEYVEGWFDALDDCAAKKKMSSQCILYRLNWHEDILKLAWEVWNRTYHPTTSVCFIVTHPKLREVFAANFRDRIVQHWLCLRLEPLFERRFVEQGNVSFNCRTGFGTLACVEQIRKDTIDVSENYTKEAWYAQFDIKGFFMSIDCELLLNFLLPFIRDNWDYWKGGDFDKDLELCLWLTEVIVRHRPQDDCKRQGNVALWKVLPKGKSLFDNAPMRGEPIGNLTSQLFANFYMSFFDAWAIAETKKRGARFIRFVDDFVFICQTKTDALWFRKESEKQLREVLHVKMHPNKVYIQEVKKGIKMVGGVVKPGRTYLSNRTVGGFINSVKQLEIDCKNIDKKAILSDIKSVNSYMGFLVHHHSYAIRRMAFRDLKYFWKVCYIQGHYQVVKPRKKVLQCL